MKYKAIIWDMDGTLMSTLEDLTDSVNHALAQFGMPPRTLEETRRFVGNGIGRFVRLSMPEGESDETVSKVLECFTGWYGEHCRIKSRPYNGVTTLLERLKQEGFKMAIVSNKIDFALKIIAKECFGDSVDVVIGEQEGLARKPAPDMVYKALEELGVEKNEAVYIGDSDVDLKTARNSGLDCVNVLWGFRTKEELTACGADTFVSDTDELYSLLTK